MPEPYGLELYRKGAREKGEIHRLMKKDIAFDNTVVSLTVWAVCLPICTNENALQRTDVALKLSLRISSRKCPGVITAGARLSPQKSRNPVGQLPQHAHYSGSGADAAHIHLVQHMIFEIVMPWCTLEICGSKISSDRKRVAVRLSGLGRDAVRVTSE